MNRLFWGLFFVLLDWKLTVGTAVFEILPDFIGFYFMMKGMETLAGESEGFDRGRHICFVLLLGSAIAYGAALMNPQTIVKIWLWAGELTVLIVTLVLLRWVMQDFPQGHSKSLMPVLAVMQILAQLLGWIPVVGRISNAASLIVSICFLAALWREKRNFGT